jgi:hypothetical protein
MISQATLKRMLCMLDVWQFECGVTNQEMSTLLHSLSTVEGNKSFTDTVAALGERFRTLTKGIPNECGPYRLESRNTNG